MEDKKIEKLLKSVDLPNKISVDHKNKLRRELLNSAHFEKGNSIMSLFKIERIAGGIIALALMIFIFMPNSEKVNNVKDIISLTNQHYAGFLKSGYQSNFNNEVKINGKKSEVLVLKIHQVIDHINSKYRLTAFDGSNEVKLDDYIIDGDKVYRSNNNKLHYKNTTSSFADFNTEISYTVTVNSDAVCDSMQLMVADSLKINVGDSTKGKIIIKKLSTNAANDEAFIVYQGKVNNNSEISNLKPFYFPVDKKINVVKYFKANPVDIMLSLSEKDSINMFDQDYEGGNGIKCVIVQRTEKITRKKIKDLAKELDSINQNNTIVQIEFLDTVKKQLELVLDGLDLDEKLESIEKIRINPENGEIYGVVYEIKRNGKKLKLSEISFNDQRLVKNRSNDFNISEEFSLLTNVKTISAKTIIAR